MVQVSATIPLNNDKQIDEAGLIQLFRHQYSDDLCQKIDWVLSQYDAHADQTLWNFPLRFVALEMAAGLFELNVEPTAVLAALLHPLVLTQNIDLKLLAEHAGDDILKLLKEASKLNAAQVLISGNRSGAQVDRLRKMLLAMINDVRVVLVKLAERLVIMRHLDQLPDEEAKQVAQGVSEVYAPLANRLGIGQLKWELEDRAFKCLESEAYRHVTSHLDERRLDRENYIEEMIAQLQSALKAQGVEAEISGRVKHIYSIYRKMQKKHLKFEGLFDIQAMRILVKDVSSCYRSLSVVHELWEGIQSEFDDYISTPKPNGYRSIHTVVKGPFDKNIEIQIRTYAMHEESEMGVAAHWRYKEGSNRDASFESRISWMRNLLDWQQELGEKDESMEAIRSKVVDDRVYVFTPEGKVMDLPRGATPLDFAYHVHTEVGHRCRGAKVHGKMVPLTYQLETGDQVSILTSKESRPSRDWLSTRVNYVKTNRARNKIAHWFRLQNKDENAAMGKERLHRECQKSHFHQWDVEALVTQFNQVHLEDFYAAIATNDIKLQSVLTAIKLQQEGEVADSKEDTFTPKLSTSRQVQGDFLIDGLDNAMIIPAGCCHPIAGDPIAGYITQGHGIKVHKADCSQYLLTAEKSPERLIGVSWSEQVDGRYPVEVSVYAQNRSGLLRDLTLIISNESLSISKMDTQVDKRNQMVTVKLEVDVNGRDQAGRLKELLMNVPKVIQVEV